MWASLVGSDRLITLFVSTQRSSRFSLKSQFYIDPRTLMGSFQLRIELLEDILDVYFCSGLLY